MLGLRGTTDLNSVCLPLIQIINREIESDDEKVTQAVKTISSLIVDSNLLRVQQRLAILRLIQQKLDLTKILDVPLFIDKSSSNLQMYLWNLIELTGLRRQQATRQAADQILAAIFSRISVTGV